jgi:hypothetical protein
MNIAPKLRRRAPGGKAQNRLNHRVFKDSLKRDLYAPQLPDMSESC